MGFLARFQNGKNQPEPTPAATDADLPGKYSDCTTDDILMEILHAVNGSAPPTGVATLSSSVQTVSGNIIAGALSLVVTGSDDFTGSFNGAPRAAGFQLTIALDGKTLPSIPYVITTGSITLDILT